MNVILQNNTLESKCYDFFSFKKPISIKNEILLSELSIKKLSELLAPDDKILTKNEVVSQIRQLEDKGKLSTVNNSIQVKYEPHKVITDIIMQQQIEYLISILPKEADNPNYWQLLQEFESFADAVIYSAIDTKLLSKGCLCIALKYVDYFILSAQYNKGNQLIEMLENLPFTKTTQRHELTCRQAEILRMQGKNTEGEKKLEATKTQLETENTLNSELLSRVYGCLGMIILYDDSERFNMAETYLNKALNLAKTKLGIEHKQTLLCQLYMAEYYNQKGKPPKVHEIYSELSTQPLFTKNKHYQSWMFDIMGLAVYFSGNFSEAINHCKKGLEIRQTFLPKGHPLLLESLHNVGYMLYIGSKYTDAIPYLNETYMWFKKTYTPEHQNYLITAGAFALCNKALGNYNEAKRILCLESNEINNYPRKKYNLFGTALEQMAKFFYDTKQLDMEYDLIKSYIGLLKVRPEKYDGIYANTLKRFLLICKDTLRYDEVRDTKMELSDCCYFRLKNNLNSDKANADVYNEYGIYFKNTLNDYQRAANCYKKVIELEPNHTTVYNNYALLLTSIFNKNDKAEEFYRKSIQLDPYDNAAKGNFALFIQNIQRDYDMAERYYVEALWINGTDPANLTNYASLKLIQGDIDEAKTLVNKSLEICKRHPNRYMARTLLVLLIIRMFECNSYEFELTLMKSLFRYGMDHICYDNRELMRIAKTLIKGDEFQLVQKIYNAIADFDKVADLGKDTRWEKVAVKEL